MVTDEKNTSTSMRELSAHPVCNCNVPYCANLSWLSQY